MRFGLGIILGLMLAAAIYNSGRFDQFVEFIKPAEPTLEQVVADAEDSVKAAPLSQEKRAKKLSFTREDLDELTHVVIAEGGKHSGAYFLIALAAKNYVVSHLGTDRGTYASLRNKGYLVMADRQKPMWFRLHKTIRGGAGVHKGSALYKQALGAAALALKGEYPEGYDPSKQTWLSCISRIGRTAGQYAKVLRKTNTKGKLIIQFGKPRFEFLSSGESFFCPK